jgi:hypothetical protein
MKEPSYDYTKTHEAMDAYFEHQSTFDEMIDDVRKVSNVISAEIFDDWVAKEKELKLKVGQEFVKVTPNSEDKASLVEPYDLIRITDYITLDKRNK